MKNNKNGFTLIELLIVIGIIAILAVSIIIAINPGQQFAQARDATRQGHINSLNQAILSYMVSNHGDLSGLNLPPTPTEICAVTSTCEGLVNLEPLLTGGHLSAIPIDPSGGTLTNGSGYRIFTYGSDPAIHASKAETRAIQIGNWSFTDPRDGNAYKTVLIGDQLWMAENLAYLPSVNSGEDGSTTDPRYYVYGYNGTDVAEAKSQTNYTTHGVLYNHPAARVACPTGWHLPTDTEYKTLEMYLGMTQEQADATGWRGTDQGTKLKSGGSSGWNGLMSGYREISSEFFRHFGTHGYWWSSSVSSGNAWRRTLYSSDSTVTRGAYNQGDGYSVRCLRD